MWNDTIKAVLIGTCVYEYKSFPDIPNVNSNIDLLKAALKNPDLFGCSDFNIREFRNQKAADIVEGIHQFVFENDQFTDRLLIYYSGHGALEYNDENRQTLYLTTTDTKGKNLDYNAIPIEKLKSILRKSRASKKVLILDCCYSGKALESGTLGGDAPSIIEKQIQADEEGGFILTSTDAVTTARFDVKNPEEPTYFTKCMIDIINDGIEGIGEFCMMKDVYLELKGRLIHPDMNLPEPKCNSRENGSTIRFVKNKKWIKPDLTDKQAWKNAKLENSISAFEQFIKDYPESDFIEDAHEKIFDLNMLFDWRKTYSSLEPIAYHEFIGRYRDYFKIHPDHILLVEANKKIIDCEKFHENHKETVNWQQQASS